MKKIIPEKAKRALDRAYDSFHSTHSLSRDPVFFPNQFHDPLDQEVSGFIAALLAYGNVKMIFNSVAHVLSLFGSSPHQFILNGKLPEKFNFRHRFTTGEDLIVLCHWLSIVYRSHGSIEAFFNDSESTNHSMKEKISSFVRRLTLLSLPNSIHTIYQKRSRSLKYLLSDPERGSACKRMNMFLRWVVRAGDGIDLGLWKSVDPSFLMLPVDTHLLQTLRKLRWTRSKTATWIVVEQATEILRQICPEDPIRFDFSLCHLSMRGFDIRDFYEK